MVKVFSFQRGLWTDPSTHVFLRYNFTKDNPPLFTLSACYWIRFEVFGPQYDLHISYKIKDNNLDPIYFGNRGDTFDFFFDSTENPGLPEWGIYPEVWRHVCHILQNSSYKLFYEGDMVYNGDLIGEWPLYLNGCLILGQEQDSYSGGFVRSEIFRGDISQMSFWDYPIEPAEAKAMANCKYNGRGNLFSLETFEIENFGVKETMAHIGDLCKDVKRRTILPERLIAMEAQAECALLNASLVVPLSESENNELKNAMAAFGEISLDGEHFILWLGLKIDTNGTWRNMETDEPVPYTNFQSITSGLSCSAIKSNGYWIQSWCDGEFLTACHFQDTDFMYLRGLCYSIEHKTKFWVAGYIDNKLYFKGFYGEIIYWSMNDETWFLASTISNKTLLILSESEKGSHLYLLGKTKWRVVEETCGYYKGSMITLSLSICESYQFMCNSGLCISHQKRCNLIPDCVDASDEINCYTIENTSEMVREIPPFDHLGQATSMSTNIEIKRIANIDDINMSVTLELQLAVSWIDQRLKFRHLNTEKATGTTITKGDQEKLWKPSYHFANLEGGYLKMLGQSLIVSSSNNVTLPGFNNIDMDLIYPASTNPLMMSTHYSARVTCYFDLYIYPFDEQTCTIDIEIPSEQREYVQFSTTERSVTYIGPQTLSNYNIKNVRFDPTSGFHRLNVAFELERLSGVTFFSTFLPSTMLLVISWATLFIGIEDLNVRAIMSLTTLLVLYTLFANMSRSLPSTASAKLIDYWFFFLIFSLFVNIMIHVFTPKSGKCNFQSIKVIPAKDKLGDTVESDKVPRHITFLKMYRTIGLPVMILVFNIVFWSIILHHKLSK